MKPSVFSRKIFKIAAFAIFIYQMQESMHKFVKVPIVNEVSYAKLDDVTQKPKLYICQDNQQSILKSRTHGYEWLVDFLAGNANGSDVSTWRGSNNNLTYDELVLELHTVDFDDVKVYFDGWSAEDEVGTEEVYKVSYGFCRMVRTDQAKERVYVASKKKVKVLLIDPNTDVKIYIEQKLNTAIFVPGFKNGSGFDVLYKMYFEIQDDSILHGSSCMDYSRVGSSYSTCIQDEFKVQLVDWFGCIPPWYDQTSPLSCPNDESTKKLNATQKKNVTLQLYRLMSHQPLKRMKRCLRPCLTTNIKGTRLCKLTFMR